MAFGILGILAGALGIEQVQAGANGRQYERKICGGIFETGSRMLCMIIRKSIENIYKIKVWRNHNRDLEGFKAGLGGF